METVRALLAERNAAQAELARRGMAERVEKALDQGIISPAMRPWDEAPCARDPVSFGSFCAAAGPVFGHLFKRTHASAVPPGSTATAAERPDPEVDGARRGLAEVRKEIDGLRPPMCGAAAQAGEMERAMSAAIGGLSRNFARMALQATGITSVSAALIGSVRGAANAERSKLRLQAVVRAIGAAAGRTAADIEAPARSIGRETLASTESVRQAAAQLLTFRSVAGETFDHTLRAAQDLAEVGFGSIESAAVQLGRALEDPEQGLNALRRSGISFSASQREVIKELVETGRVAEAQRLILEGLEKPVGGTGAPAGDGLRSAFDAHAAAEQAPLLTEAEETARRIREGGGGGGGGGGAAALREEASAVRDLNDSLVREVDIQREADPVRRALAEHREVLADATVAERGAVESLIETRIREAAQLEPSRALWQMVGRTAVDALTTIALEGRSVRRPGRPWCGCWRGRRSRRRSSAAGCWAGCSVAG